MSWGSAMIDTNAETSERTKYKWYKERYPEQGQGNQCQTPGGKFEELT